MNEIYSVLVEGKGLRTIYGYTIYQWLGMLIGSAVGVFGFWLMSWGLYIVFGF